jgi:hypothetical protein
MTIHEAVKKLVGEIDPVGETNEDDRRFENLTTLCTLIDDLKEDVECVARQKHNYQFSVQRAGREASSFLEKL